MVPGRGQGHVVTCRAHREENPRLQTRDSPEAEAEAEARGEIAVLSKRLLPNVIFSTIFKVIS